MPDLQSQITSFRTSGHKLEGYLSVYKGSVAATFTVNAVPTYPTSALAGTYTTGSAADVDEGFLCEIRTSGGALRGITRTRYGATQTSTSLKIRELSRGEIVIANGDVVTIRREVRLSDLLVAATAGFEPDMITYTDQGSAVIPMPNSGGGWAGFVDTGQTFASVAFFGNLSYTLDPDSSGTITHVWTIPSGGGAFQAGSTSTSANPVIEFNVGCWLLKHVVTDSSNSKSTTQYIPVCVHNTTTNPPVSTLTQSLSGTPENGWSYSCQVFDSADLTSIPDGSLVFFWVKERIAGTIQSFGSPVTGRSHIKMVGYIRRETERSEAGTGELTFEIISPLTRLSELPGFSKVLQREVSPNAWGEIIALDTFLAIAFLHLFYANWNRAGFDFIKHANYTTLPYPLFFLNKDNPLGQIRELARATDARIVCNRHGRMELQPVLHLLDRTTRNGLVTILTLIRSDWFDIEISREHYRPVETVYCKGFTGHASDPTPIFAKWPGDAPGQGSLTDSIERLIYLNASVLFARTGLHGAYKDGWFVDSNLVGHFVPKIRLTLPGSYDVWDWYAEWVQLNITTSIREIALTTFRYTLESVDVRYENGTATTSIELQAETFGEPGVDDTPVTSNTAALTDPSSIWGTQSFDPFAPVTTLYSGTNTVAAFMMTDDSTNAASLFVTTNFTLGASSTWAGTDLVALGLGGRFIDCVQDPFAPTSGWILSTTQVRRITGIFSTPALGTAFALGLSGDDIIQRAQIHTNIAAQNFAVVSFWKTSAGTPSRNGHYLARTTDGTNWSVAKLSDHLAGGGFDNTNNGVNPPAFSTGGALFVSAHRAGWVYAADAPSTSGRLLRRLLKSIDYGVTFTPIFSLPDPGGGAFDYSIRAIFVPYHNNADENIIYFSASTTFLGAAEFIYQSGVVTEITPFTRNTRKCGFWRCGVDASVFDRTRMRGFAIENHFENVNFAGGNYTESNDAGTTWSDDLTASTVAECIAIAGDNPDVLFRWGYQGKLDVSVDDGTNWVDHSGNLPGAPPDPGDNRIVRIMGG